MTPSSAHFCQIDGEGTMQNAEFKTKQGTRGGGEGGACHLFQPPGPRQEVLSGGAILGFL